jgi:PPOX class probable F420-dependent enzyme
MTNHSHDQPDIDPGRLEVETLRQLLSMRLIANLATYDPDGSIHLVPMWFRHQDDALLIPTSHRTRKIRNLRRRPWAAVMIHHAVNGLDLRGALIRGDVELIEAPLSKELNRSIHSRYVTAEGLEKPEVIAYLRQGDDVTIKVAMQEVITWNLAAGPAARSLHGPGLAHPLD